MKLVLAEKPSVAQSIAKVLPARRERSPTGREPRTITEPLCQMLFAAA